MRVRPNNSNIAAQSGATEQMSAARGAKRLHSGAGSVGEKSNARRSAQQRAEATLRRMHARLHEKQQAFESQVAMADASAFVQSFDASETHAIRRFLARYGFVCVRVLERQVCDDAVRAVVAAVAEQAGEQVTAWHWSDYVNALMPEGYSTGVLDGSALAEWQSAGGALAPAPSAWGPQAVVQSVDFEHASDDALLQRLPLRVDRLTHSQAMWSVRTDANLYRVFADLLQTSQLYTTVGCVHFMRPKKARPHTLRQDWRNHIKTTFWDRPPQRDEFAGFAGLQVLTDATASDGGLELVPGFHSVYADWLALLDGVGAGKRPTGFAPAERVLLPKSPFAEQLVNTYMQRIAVRAGTVIVVDRRLPMRTYPNNSASQPFVALEVSMTPQFTLRNDVRVDNTARRLRYLAYACGVRFVSLPALTGHYAVAWSRWPRAVAAPQARAHFVPATLDRLGQCLLGVQRFTAQMLAASDLPQYNDVKSDDVALQQHCAAPISRLAITDECGAEREKIIFIPIPPPLPTKPL